MTSGEIVSQAVATALTDDPGLGITAKRAHWPKYALADLAELTVDVIVEFPASMDAHDRGSTATDVPIVVLVQQRCEPTDAAKIASLTEKLESIAQWLALNPAGDLGPPIEPINVDRNDDLLGEGQFLGGVAVVYRLFREALET